MIRYPSRSGNIRIIASGLCIALVCVLPVSTPARCEVPIFTGQSVVLLEEFTAIDCQNCPFVAGIMDKLWKTLGPSKVAIVAYHMGDELQPSGVSSRTDYYAIDATPTTEIDGSKEIRGGDLGYTTYNSTVTKRLAIARNFTIISSGTVASGNIDVHLEQDIIGYTGNIKLRYTVIESNVTVGLQKYNFVARALPTPDTITLPVPQGGVDFTKTFTVGPSWNSSRLTFIAFLQDDNTKEVLQTCVYGYAGSTVPEVPITAYLTFLLLGWATIIAFTNARRKKIE